MGLASIFNEFLASSTIHGLNHLVDGNLSILQRTVWATILTVCLALAIIMLKDAFSDWEANPKIDIVESTSFPIENIDFPTVTLCPVRPDPDRWGIIIKTFDWLDMQCKNKDKKRITRNVPIPPPIPPPIPFPPSLLSPESERECTKIQKLFHSLRTKINEEIFKKGTQTLKNQSIEELMEDRFVRTHFSAIQKLAFNGPKMLEDLDDIKSTLGLLEKPLLYLVTWITQKPISSLIPGNQTECKNECADMAKELSIKLKLLHETHTSFTLKGSTGQFLSYFKDYTGTKDVSYISESFSWPYSVMKNSPSEFEEKLNEYLIEMAKEISNGSLGNVSIIDFPSFGSMFDFHDSSPDWRTQMNFQLYSTTKKSSFELFEEFRTRMRKWRQYMANHEINFPSWSEGKHSFNFTQYILKDFETFITVIHDSGLVGEGILSYKEIATKIMSPIRESQKTKTYLPNSILTCNYNGRINLESSFAKTCKLFQPVLTSNGLCQSFGGTTPSKIWKKSPITDAFEKSLKAEHKNYKFRGAGAMEGLQMVIDSRPYIPIHNQKPYILGISSKNGMIDQKRSPVEIKPGHEISIRLVPQVVDIDKSFLSLDQKDRNCKMSHETAGFMFLKKYTRAGCEFECAARDAQRICKCLPWHISNDFVETPICEMFGAKCFDMIMSLGESHKKCPEFCAEDCKHVSYMIFPTYVPIDTEQICKLPFFAKHISEYKKRKEFAKVYEKYVLGIEEKSAFEECKTYVKNHISIVTIESSTGSVFKTIRKKRVTFTDQLAIIGGTLGLFSGISILSIAELFCCFANLLSKWCKRQNY